MIYTLQGVDEESEIGKSWTPLNLKAGANICFFSYFCAFRFARSLQILTQIPIIGKLRYIIYSKNFRAYKKCYCIQISAGTAFRLPNKYRNGVPGRSTSLTALVEV